MMMRRERGLGVAVRVGTVSARITATDRFRLDGDLITRMIVLWVMV